MNQHCDITGKRAYRSKAEAKKGMRKLHDRLRIYLCQHCHWFHLTSDKRGRS